MRRSSLAVHVALLIVSMVALTTMVQAQFGSSLEGTVTDKTGAVVAGATVTITDQATGISHSTVTGAAGCYRITDAPPGNYKVDVDAPGFKKNTRSGISVGSEAASAANITLETGSNSETVTLRATPSALQTEDASIQGTIS